MMLFVVADASEDSTISVNLWFVALVLVIIATLIYIFRHRRL